MRKIFLPERLEKKLTDPFHSVDEHNEELYQFLSENLDEGGRPTLDDIQFVRTTDTVSYTHLTLPTKRIV